MATIGEVLRGTLARPGPDPALPEGVPAAVLIPILDLEDPSVILTRRTHDVRHHRGEISFPGGAVHADDADLLATALRETEEEVGITPEAVEVVGALSPTQTFVSGYVVLPFVGLLARRPALRPNPLEVAEVLELSVADLAAAEREMARAGPAGTYHSYVYEVGGHTVWGVTGTIVHALLQTLRQEGWT